MLVGFGHGLAQGLDQRLRAQDLLHAAADFRGNADALLTIDGNGKRRHPPFAHHLDFTLDGVFDVLRVEVVPAHDQHVFQTTSDVQLAITHKAQVASAQPGAAVLRDETLCRCFRVAPVAMGNTRPGSPDLTDGVFPQHGQAQRLHHTHGVVRLIGTATHDGAALAWRGLVLGQCAIVQAQCANALASLAASDKQGGLGQTV
ncbi:hypothetical protein D3C76_1121650 [compost metagenome]